MEKQYTALLYSKYSKSCTEIINIIENSNIDFSKQTKLLPVCIDNDEIRKKIISSSNIEIHSVPTILIIYEDGGVEKYEGNDAFSWVQDIIDKKSPMIPQQPQPMQQQPIPQPMMQQQPIPQSPMMQPQPMPQNTMMQQQPIPQPPMQQPPMMQPQPPMMQPQQENNIESEALEGMTSIEEMEPELEPIYEEELEQYQKFDREDVFPPKNASLRSGANSYDVNTSFGKKKSDLKVVRGIKSNVNNDKPTKKGKVDVMSAAMEMQKSREREEEGLPKAPFGL